MQERDITSKNKVQGENTEKKKSFSLPKQAGEAEFLCSTP